METECFDDITTQFAQTHNRRGALRLLGVAVLGVGGLSLLGAEEADAKRKRRKKKRKNRGGGNGNGGGDNARCLRSGDLCQTDSQCCSGANQICEVPQNASNSDHRCCGAAGAVCGGVNEDGDFLEPYCCIGEAGVRSFVCSQSDPNNPFVQGTCIPAPPDL